MPKFLDVTDRGAARSAIAPGGVDFISEPVETVTFIKAAAIGEVVPCDATVNVVAVTLPNAPADGASVSVKKVDSSNNAVNVVRSGADVFETVGGATSYSITVPATVTFTYFDGVWRVMSHGYQPAALAKSYGSVDVAEALFNRMSVAPNRERRKLVTDLIEDLMSAGVWDRLDGLYVFAAHDRQAALLNWVGGGNPVPPLGSAYNTWKPPSMRDCTEVNGPVFTADRGFAGDGRRAYLDTNTPGSDLSLYTVTDAATGIYTRTVADGTVYDIAGLGGLAVNPSNTSSLTVVYANGPIVTASNGGDKTGLFGFTRLSNNITVYKDGASIGTGSSSSTTFPSETLLFLRSFWGFSSRQISAGFFGKSLTADQWSDLNAALTIYLTAIGAAV